MTREPKIDDEVIFCDGSKILQGFIFAIYKGKIFHVKTKEGDFVLRKEEMFDNFFDIYEKMLRSNRRMGEIALLFNTR